MVGIYSNEHDNSTDNNSESIQNVTNFVTSTGADKTTPIGIMVSIYIERVTRA